MQHRNHRPAFAMPLRHLVKQYRHSLRINRGEWLVEQDDSSILQDQSGKQRSLQLTD